LREVWRCESFGISSLKWQNIRCNQLAESILHLKGVEKPK
jgi:hypothetical protein